MVRPKSENTIRKHFKVTEETANECSKVENMNEKEEDKIQLKAYMEKIILLQKTIIEQVDVI